MTTIQTSALVDGVWTTQEVNLQDILYQKDAETQQQEINHISDDLLQPQLGVLTQTVLESFVARWIFPIRLQRDGDQDAAFISETSLRICQVLEQGSLRELVCEADFGSRILSALVADFVDPVSSPTEETQEPQTPTKSRLLNSQVQQNGGIRSPRDWQEHSLPPSRLPPQCVVLALENGSIVFVTPVQHDGQVLLTVTHQEATKPWLSEQPGRYLAIDPNSTYLAVGSTDGHLTVFELDSGNILQAPTIAGRSNHPVRSLRHFRVGGTILKMEFLQPKKGCSSPTVLLLLASFKGHTWMHVFRWANALELIDGQDYVLRGRYLLPPALCLPLLLIPLSFRCSFLLVCEGVIVVCEGIMEDYPRYEPLHINEPGPSRLYCGRGRPLWTAYTKPIRTGSYAERHDDLYLAREDGIVKFIEMEDSEMQAEMLAGAFDCTIGTAFASLGRPDTSATDTLIAGGEYGNGAIYEIIPKMDPRLISVVHNRSPMFDLVAIPSSVGQFEPKTRRVGGFQRGKIEQALRQPDELIASVGKEEMNSVMKLRHGYEARPSLEIPYGSPVSTVWALGEHGRPWPHILANVGDQSSFLQLPVQADESIMNMQQHETWLDLPEKTLFFAFKEGLSVQVTKDYIRVSHATWRRGHSLCHIEVLTSSNPCKSHQISTESLATITAMTICSRLILLAAIDASGNAFIHNLHVTSDGLTLAHTTVLSRKNLQPTVLTAIHVSSNHVYCLIGFDKAPDQDYGEAQSVGFVSLFNIDIWTRVSTYVMDIPVSDTQANACTALSTVCGTPDSPQSHFLLLAGFRDGQLATFEFTFTADSDHSYEAMFRGSLGSTAVSISTDDTLPNKVVLRCGAKIYGAIYHQGIPLNCSMYPICITDNDDVTVDQVCLYQHGLLLSTPAGFLVTSLSWTPADLPSSVEFKEDGSDSTKQMKHAYTMPEETAVFRIEKSTITAETTYLADAQTSHHQYLRTKARLGRHLLCVKAWGSQKGLAVCGHRNGRLHLHHPDDPEVIRDISLDMATDLTAIGTWEDNVVCGAGEYLTWIKCVADHGDPRFIVMAGYELPSHAVSIQVLAQDTYLLVYVLTARHSLLTYRFRGDDILDAQIRPFGADEVSRDGLDAFHIPKIAVTLVSDKAGSVTGLFSNCQDDRIANWGAYDCTTMFEAEMPFSVIKLFPARTRPPWDPIWKGKLEFEAKLPGVYYMNGYDILGATSTGSITSFTIIYEDLWIMLCFLQQLVENSKDFCPNTWFLPRPPMNRTSPLAKHINGDLLRKIVGPGKLKKLIPDDSSLNARESIRMTFLKLAAMVTKTQYGSIQELIELQDEAMKWGENFLLHLLRPVI